MATKQSPIEWDHVSFVLSSKYRQIVLGYLVNGPATPSKIERNREISMSHVSRALGDLRDLGLVDLLVSEERHKGRVYGATEAGRTAFEHASDVEGELELGDDK